VEEGRLHEHQFYDDRYWDYVYLALYRKDWNSRSAAARATVADNLLGGDLSLEGFISAVASALGGDPSGWTPEADLNEHLGLDSLALVQIWQLITDAAGDVEPPAAFENIHTLRDAYLAYCEATSLPLRS
jgi:acyl carrier protein